MFRVLIAGLCLLALPATASAEETHSDCFRREAPQLVERGIDKDRAVTMLIERLCEAPIVRHAEELTEYFQRAGSDSTFEKQLRVSQAFAFVEAISVYYFAIAEADFAASLPGEHYQACFRRVALELVERGYGIDDGAGLIYRRLCTDAQVQHSLENTRSYELFGVQTPTSERLWERDRRESKANYLHQSRKAMLIAMGVEPAK